MCNIRRGEILWEVVVWIVLVQHRVRCLANVNTVMSFGYHKMQFLEQLSDYWRLKDCVEFVLPCDSISCDSSNSSPNFVT